MFIHVNSHKIRARDPKPIAIRKTRSAKPQYVESVLVAGPCKVVYDPDRPLPCGAKVWVETLNDDGTRD